MAILPLMQFVSDQEGTQWAVLFAGPLAPPLGMRRQIVFRANGQQLIIAHDWVAEPPAPSRLLSLLASARDQDS